MMRSLLISLNHFSLFFELLVQWLHIFNTYFFSLNQRKIKLFLNSKCYNTYVQKNYSVFTVQSLKLYSCATNILKLSWLLTSEFFYRNLHLYAEFHCCYCFCFFALCYWRWYILWTPSTHYNNKHIFFHLVQQFIVNKSRHTNMDFLFLVGD